MFSVVTTLTADVTAVITYKEDIMRFRAIAMSVPVFIVASGLLIFPVRGQERIALDKMPSPVKTVQPVYPRDALKEGVEGVVYVAIHVDEKGTVTKAKIEKSDAESLNQAALDAARQWTFTPGISKDEKKPVAVWLTVPFKFKLQDGEKGKK
jgi:TonB family protein